MFSPISGHIAAIATGQVDAVTMRALRAAEHGRRLFLTEGARRKLRSSASPEEVELVDRAHALLSKAQKRAPQAVAEVLTLPQVAGWAVTCLSAEGLPSAVRTGYLCTLASAAAARSHIPFDLPAPVGGGVVTLPGFGALSVGTPGDGWVRLSLNESGTLIVDDGADRVAIDPRQPSDAWAPVQRVLTLAEGLTLDLLLDTDEQLTSRFGVPPERDAASSTLEWSKLLDEAWQILARRHRGVAESMTYCLRTLVPLPSRGGGSSTPSATSGWLWGAIAVGLPSDSWSLAEVLVHEFHHLLLASLEDEVSLVEKDSGRTMYAPWRDDPRPLSGLLHGTFANIAMADFWRKEAEAATEEGLPEALRAEIEFAWRRSAVLRTVRDIGEAGGLTTAGRRFLTGLSQWLEELGTWQVTEQAARLANELVLEHRLRWRLAHLVVDASAVDALANAWTSCGRPHARLQLPAAQVVPGPPSTSRLHDLMMLRARSPYTFAARLAGQTDMDPLDRALLRGHHAFAIRVGSARLIAGDSASAWVALAIAASQPDSSAEYQPLLSRPELVAAVHERIRKTTGTAPDPVALVEWLGDGGYAPA